MRKPYECRRLFFGRALLGLLSAFSPIHLMAQSGAGTISGAVHGQTGAVVAGATITVLNTGKNCTSKGQ